MLRSLRWGGSDTNFYGASGGKYIHIGTYDTAVEAAVAYAKHIKSIGGAEPEEEEDNEAWDWVQCDSW